MNLQEIKDNLFSLADFSTTISKANVDNNTLFDLIDHLPQDAKEKLNSEYAKGAGPVLGIRKQVAEEILQGPVNRVGVVNQFDAAKSGTPSRFVLYKNLYSILYPFCFYTQKDLLYNTMDALAQKLREDLQLVGKADIKCYGFDGARNTGSTRAWFAIYNNTHPNQRNAKQLFFLIENGVLTYAAYDRSKKQFIESNTCSRSEFDYNTVLQFYNKYKTTILLDNFQSNLLAKYPLGELVGKLTANEIKAWVIKPGEKAFMWPDALKEGNIRIGWGDVVGDVYDQDNFTDAFILERLDVRYGNGEAKGRQLNNKGSIRSFLVDIKEQDVVFAVSGNSEVVGVGIVTSPTVLDETNAEYKAFHKVDWLIDLSKNPFKPDLKLPIKTVTQYLSHSSVPLICSIFNYTPPKIMENINVPFLNTILYGPPGTGKTHTLRKYQTSLFTDIGVTKNSKELLHEKVNNYYYWEVIAAILNASDRPLSVAEIVNAELMVARTNDTVKTKLNNILWSVLQGKADDESTNLQARGKSIKVFHKDDDSKWSIVESVKPQLADMLGIELLGLAKNPTLTPSVTFRERFLFITFHQKYSYEDFIEGVRPVLKDPAIEGAEQSGDLQFMLKKGVFYKSCLAALELVGYSSFQECKDDDPQSRIERFKEAKNDPSKRFALFIDEINRANISAVLGELITLLEDDKRIGAIDDKGNPTEMWMQLPGSESWFSVPANLYVIGTMNTADRSIALLDIALRRRFEFKALYPEYPEGKWWTPVLMGLNSAIFEKKKNADFFIGHAFFINKEEPEKVNIFNSKIIPLLLEYFQNNTDTVRYILDQAKIVTKPLDLKSNFQIVAE